MAGKGFAIVGGGQAGAWAARTLRKEGFDDRLTIVTTEAHLPYERPPLSKQLLLGQSEIEAAYVFPAKSYVEWGIDLRLGTTVARLDTEHSRIELSDGNSLEFDRLLIATGGRPRKLNPGGSVFDNIFYLRSVSDAIALRQALRAQGHALILGGGWIGLEVAAAARKLGNDVTIVESASQLCSRAAPSEVSEFLLDLHSDHGVNIRLNTTVVAYEGKAQVERVRLSDGETLDVSVVIVGIGITPAIELAAGANLLLDNGIVVDDCLQTSVPRIFAAGDVANFCSDNGQRMRLKSWDNAQKQGTAAGQSMLGKPIKLDRYPWFWSDQYNQNIQLVGSVSGYSDRVQVPSGAGSSVRLYLRDGQVIGAIGINAGRDIRLIKRRLEAGQAVEIPTATQSVYRQEAIKQ